MSVHPCGCHYDVAATNHKYGLQSKVTCKHTCVCCVRNQRPSLNCNLLSFIINPDPPPHIFIVPPPSLNCIFLELFFGVRMHTRHTARFVLTTVCLLLFVCLFVCLLFSCVACVAGHQFSLVVCSFLHYCTVYGGARKNNPRAGITCTHW
jgi:hypothetical protein